MFCCVTTCAPSQSRLAFQADPAQGLILNGEWKEHAPVIRPLMNFTYAALAGCPSYDALHCRCEDPRAQMLGIPQVNVYQR